MKRIYSFIILGFLTSVSFAQLIPRPQSPSTPFSAKAKKDEAPQSQASATSNSSAAKLSAPIPLARIEKSMPMWQQLIGFTNYDNQSNNSTQDRIIVGADGVAHAAWMLSNEGSGWTDRGTGYNSGEGYEWDVEPVDRIESVRTGWPDLHQTESGQEFYVCHDGTGPIHINRRPTVGSGTWTLTEIPTALTVNILWPRAAVDGNTIHVIALSEPSTTANPDPAPVNGLNGNLIYWRSEDGGATWAVQDHIFMELDVAEYEGISADTYAIDARQGDVSIAIFSRFHDAALLSSSDDGDNWTYTIISDFEISGYLYDTLSDSDGDLVADTLFTTDGTGALVIDGAGVTHVFFGSNFIVDDTPDDTFYTYFFTFDLLYWNDTYETNEIYICATAEEDETDDDETFTIGSADEVSNFTRSLAGMPSVTEDEDGIIYVVYSGADEYYLGDHYYRHLYVVTTEDSGVSFLPPVELTPDEDEEFYEFVYPSVVENDGILHIVAQRDFEAGVLVAEVIAGDASSTDVNDIIYLAITTDLDTDVSVEENEQVAQLNVYPSPTAGIVNLEGENLDKQSLKVYDMSGKQMVNTTISGRDKVSFDFSFLPDGIYSLTIGSGKNKMSTEILIQK